MQTPVRLRENPSKNTTYRNQKDLPGIVGPLLVSWLHHAVSRLPEPGLSEPGFLGCNFKLHFYIWRSCAKLPELLGQNTGRCMANNFYCGSVASEVQTARKPLCILYG